MKYELIGVLFGLAIFNDVILDIKFPHVIYKKLLRRRPSLEDMAEIDPDIHSNLKFLLTTNEPNLRETLGVNFEVETESFGERVAIPLCKGGESLPVDETNKAEYVELYLDWFFNASIEKFFTPFQKGFYRVCNEDIFRIVNEQELELIICGSKELDFKELEASSVLEDGYDKESQTVRFFWEIVHEFDENQKRKFLFFLTGCDRAPIKGLGSLRMIIGRYGPDSDKLPCAHTCFNYLLLPDYQNKEKLRNRLLLAIENSEGFGMI